MHLAAVILRPRHPPAVCCADMHHNRSSCCSGCRPGASWCSSRRQSPSPTILARYTLRNARDLRNFAHVGRRVGECMGGAVVRRFGGDSLSDGPLTDANLQPFIADSMNREPGSRHVWPIPPSMVDCHRGPLARPAVLSAVWDLRARRAALRHLHLVQTGRRLHARGRALRRRRRAQRPGPAAHQRRRRECVRGRQYAQRCARAAPASEPGAGGEGGAGAARPAAAAVRSMPVTAATTPRVSLSAPRANSAVPVTRLERGPVARPHGSSGLHTCRPGA